MLPSKVDEMLKNYREYLGRCAYLESLIKSLKLELARMMDKLTEDTVSIGGQKMDGMPHGSSVGNPTEQVGIRLADGYKPQYIIEAEKELEKATSEYDEKITTVIFVGAWLKGLTERECWIIENQVIDGVSWRELISEYHVKFGETRTKRALQMMRDKALEKVHKIAG